MRIIKLGGSLLQANTLLTCLECIAKNYYNNTVIVMGGGIFAEQVRLTQQILKFDDKTAHEMALLAMQQMALLTKSLKPCFAIAHFSYEIVPLLKRDKNTPIIWSPDIEELNQAGICATWDISSDSLAAWLANTLSARELILIKSAKIDNNLDLLALNKHGIIDNAFNGFMQSAQFKLSIIHSSDFLSESGFL